MKVNVDISVVMPIYNAMKYLADCIDSVLAQKGVSLELILVNDGSTDNSLSICQSFADNNDNVRVVSIDNSGPATAKNVGLSMATGEYVSFIDSDDALMPDMYKKMMESAHRHDADITCCSYLQIDEQGNLSHTEASNKEYVLTQEETVRRFLTKDKIYTQNWTKIYRRKMLSDNNISYVDGLKTEEDTLFNIVAFSACKIVTIVDEPLYRYTYREQSLSRDYFKTNFEMFGNNLLMKLEKVTEMVESHWPRLKPECTIYCIQYYTLLIGRCCYFDYDFCKHYLPKAIGYMKRNSAVLVRHHWLCGFSLAGAIALIILPQKTYFKKRAKKLKRASLSQD